MAATHMQRWAIFLSAYNYNIKFKGTKMHTNTDSPSRLPMEEDKDSGSKMAATMFKVSFIDGLLIMASDIAAATTKDGRLATEGGK